MADPHWTSYVGMFTGLGGIIIAILSSRKVNRIKSLDLRIELRKSVIDTHASLVELDDSMEFANRSRISMSAALGRAGSGMMQKWKEDFQNDLILKSKLLSESPDSTQKYLNLNPQELEGKLIELHVFTSKIIALQSKYTEAIRKDEEDGKQLREDQRLNR